MTVAGVGRLQRVPLREVWPHEEYDFTPWLQDNLDVLSDVIDVPISSAEREQAAGTFSVDLVGTDESSHRVIIENQFGKTNHDHLGKLITYLTAFEAQVGIWIAEQPRPEHIAAITWLNQSTAASFYLIKVEAVRIGDSPAAPILTRIVGPSLEGREVGKAKETIATLENTFTQFWGQLLERAKGQTALHGNVSPGTHQWISTSGGRSGLSLSYFARRHDAQVELYIDTGDAENNKAIFDTLAAARERIEQTFGGSLGWERLDNRRASRIRAIVPVAGYQDTERWGELQDALIDAMIGFEAALRPHIDALPR